MSNSDYYIRRYKNNELTEREKTEDEGLALLSLKDKIRYFEFITIRDMLNKLSHIVFEVDHVNSIFEHGVLAIHPDNLQIITNYENKEKGPTSGTQFGFTYQKMKIIEALYNHDINHELLDYYLERLHLVYYKDEDEDEYKTIFGAVYDAILVMVLRKKDSKESGRNLLEKYLYLYLLPIKNRVNFKDCYVSESTLTFNLEIDKVMKEELISYRNFLMQSNIHLDEQGLCEFEGANYIALLSFKKNNMFICLDSKNGRKIDEMMILEFGSQFQKLNKYVQILIEER